MQADPARILGKLPGADNESFAKFCLAVLVFLRDADAAEPGRAFDLLDAASLCVLT